jgi:hypothetical protein
MAGRGFSGSLLLMAGLAAVDAAAQCGEWTLGTSVVASPRQNHGMAYDGRNMVMFGGYRGGVGFNGETWLWNGNHWSQATPAVAPSARGNFAMAYNSAADKVILFGGALVGSVPADDTWEWDGAAQTWRELFPETKPAARYNHAMAYDEARGEVVLFGGFGAVRYADTWVFDGADWQQRTPAVSPAGRNGHQMIYDAARQKVVLFGGFPGWTNDTWEWDGANWTQIQIPGPPGRQYFSMAYDSDREVTVLACGQLAGFIRAQDTWEYDGAAWVEQLKVGMTTPPRDQNVLGYYPDRQQLVLHGGYAGGANVLSDTWTLGCGAVCEPCDANCDGAVDAFDVEPFISLLVGGGTPCSPCAADANNDGVIDAFDIEPFISCLVGP